MPYFWPLPFGPDEVEQETLPGVNRGKHRGVTKSPKHKPRKRR